MTTIFNGPYTAITASGLTQSVSRSSSNFTSPIAPIDLSTFSNFSKVLTASFTIVHDTPSEISLSATTNGLPLTRAGNTYTLSSESIVDGVKINNWAYFKKALRTLNVVTASNATAPNPAFTINSAITDGTTNLTGTISVGTMAVSVPTTPGTPTTTRNWNTNIVVSWTASTQLFGPGIAGYYIYRNGTTTPYATVYGTNTFTDTSVTNTTSYTYYIKAFDASTVPVVSSISSGTTALGVTTPTTPTLLSVTRNWNTSIVVDWSESIQTIGPGIAGYHIYRNDVLLTSVNHPTTLYTDSSVVNNTLYSYKIVAYDGTTIPVTSPYSNTISTPAATTPTTPGAITITGRNTTSLLLSWAASTQSIGPGIYGYEVYRDNVLIAATLNNAYIDTAQIGSTYTYKIRAKDNGTTPTMYSAYTADTLSPQYYIISDGATGVADLTHQYPAYVYKTTLQPSGGTMPWTTEISLGMTTNLLSLDAMDVRSINTANNTVVYKYRQEQAFSAGTSATCTVFDLNTGLGTARTMTGCILDYSYLSHTNVLMVGNTNGYIAIGVQSLNDTTYSFSSNGTTWTSYTAPLIGGQTIYGYQLFSVNNTFILKPDTGGTPNTYFFYSTNGTSWTLSNISVAAGTCEFFGDNGKFFVKIGTDHYTASSISGTWTAYALPGPTSATPIVKYVNDKWFAVPSSVNNTLWYSTDNAVTWQTASVPFVYSTVPAAQPIYLNNKYYLWSYQSFFSLFYCAESSDGINWTVTSGTGPQALVTSFNADNENKPQYWLGKFVFVTSSSTGTTTWISDDAITWTSYSNSVPVTGTMRSKY